MAFHLPYYALRSSEVCRRDHRQFENGDSLRDSQDVSFLSRMPCDSSSLLNHQLSTFLYETQISCVVAGSDEWRWVGYCFVDTYLDPVEGGKETVAQYHEDSSCGGFRGDPFTLGRVEADKPIRDPRIYFLKVLQVRLNQVKNEWQKVVEMVYQSIRHYEKVCYFSLFFQYKKSRATLGKRRKK